MSLLVLTQDTVWNPGALETGHVPRKVINRISILPRREAGAKLVARVIFESQILRYMVALTPFIIAMFVWPDLALPISQAPIAMIVAIAFVEMKVLRIKPEKRDALIAEHEAAQALDALTFRARNILSRIAARHEDLEGEILLVVEQSELANIAPLTLVSVQTAIGRPRLLALDAEDRALVRDALFDDSFTETQLQLANLREDSFVRTTTFDTRGVSGHARLAARLRQRQEAQALA
ncbi:hypothetical protein [Primorskyibacter sp. S187A]|uniref:hypothetical protein n=1 Tax=Primorskyibacter sp. S187A TaxID=3415130 RepID=UPI003C7D7D89